MDLNFTTQTTLRLLLRNTSAAIQNDILARFAASRSATAPNGRVILVDWTAAYLETVASWGVSTSGLSALTNTAVTPSVIAPHDDGLAAPTLSMKPIALDVFAISTPPVDGQLRDGEATVTLAKAGPANLAVGRLHLAADAPVAHFHWSADTAADWLTLSFSGIKQHGIRILACLIGKA